LSIVGVYELVKHIALPNYCRLLSNKLFSSCPTIYNALSTNIVKTSVTAARATQCALNVGSV